MPYDFFIFKQEPLEVVLWPDHPLAQRTALTLEEIKEEPLIYYAKSFTLHTYIRSFYQEIMAHPRIVCESSNWDLMVAMVHSHLGIALLPKSVCNRIPEGKAVHIPLVEPTIHWTLAMLWKSKGFLSHPARTWVQSFKEYFKNIQTSSRL